MPATKQSDLERARDESKKRREDLLKYNKAHHRATKFAVVNGSDPDGKTRELEIDAREGTVKISIGAFSVYLDRDAVIDLQKQLQQAFQVVA